MDKKAVKRNNVDKAYIIKVLEQEGLPVDETKAGQLMKFYEMLIEKNKVMNLTAIVDFQQVVYKHFADSIYGGRFMEIQEGRRLIDVGTGAGFPGIPLKICYPQLRVTLMDSLNKRVGFLKEVIDGLGLTGIEAVHSRAEDLGRKEEYREQYDYAVSRAVANLAVLSEYCVPFVKKGGCFLSYKSGEVEAELKSAGKAIQVLGGSVERVEKFSYQIVNPSDESEKNQVYERSIIKIKKVKETGKKYPRKAGLPGKEPIL